MRYLMLLMLPPLAVHSRAQVGDQANHDHLYIQEVSSENNEAGGTTLETILRNDSSKAVTAFVMKIQLF
jgi:hypothetical protein